jgi:hypothetical protein
MAEGIEAELSMVIPESTIANTTKWKFRISQMNQSAIDHASTKT